MEVLPLERPLLELSNRIAEMRAQARQSQLTGKNEKDLQGEIRTLEEQFEILAKQIFSNLTP